MIITFKIITFIVNISKLFITNILYSELFYENITYDEFNVEDFLSLQRIETTLHT